MKNKIHNFFFSKNNHFFCFVSIVVIFTSWTIYYRLPVANIFFLILLILISYKVLNYNRKIKKINQKIWPSLFLLLIVLARGFLAFEELSFLPFCYAIIQSLLLCSVFLLNSQDLTRTFNVFFNIFVVIIGSGLIIHILNSAGIIHLHPFSIITVGERDFAVFPIQSYNIEGGIINYFRYSSIFDEPGYLGTIGVLILIIRDYNLKDYKNLILFVSCLFTLSLSFYFLTIVYFAIKIVLYRKIRYIIPLLFGFVLFIILINEFQSLAIVMDRFSDFDSDTGLSDSRANIQTFSLYYSYLKSIDAIDLLFGKGFYASSADLGLSIGHVGWLDFLTRNGIVFSLLFFFSLFLFVKQRRSLRFTLFVLVYCLSINHRPVVITLMYFFLLASALKYNPLFLKERVNIKHHHFNETSNLYRFSSFRR